MKNKLDIVLQACEDKLGEEINVIKIDESKSLSDYFVVVTGNSKLHTQALVNEIEEKIVENEYQVFGKEGFREGGWILLDLGEIIVHVFTSEERDYYNIEKIWD